LRAVTIAVARGAYLIAGIFNHIITPIMLEKKEIGPRTAFLYAGFCVIGLVYTWFRIPETGLATREMDVLFQEKAGAREFGRIAQEMESRRFEA
jgi:MFS transporter, SP family, general alpha glucoside:H+ symporter